MVIAILRTIILYLLIILGFRLLGKHQVSELEPAEFVLALLIADVAAVPMQDFGIPILTGVIPIITLLCLSMILSMLSMKSLKLRALLTGAPSVLIRDGVVDQREMRRTRMTLDELLEELRLQGHTDLTQIRYVILETNGQLSVLPYAAQRPPTADELDVAVEDAGLPLVLINDGRLISANLKRRGLDESWLRSCLEKQGVQRTGDVFLLTVDELGRTYFVGKERD